MTAARLWRDASERLTFDLDQVSQADYPAVCKAVVEAFGLVADTAFVAGVDQLFQDWRRGSAVIGLDWDNWMGFMVVAKTPESEPLLRDIARWLCEGEWVNDGSRM
jgi:hypothetical protein